jgi:hypothetical protein
MVIPRTVLFYAAPPVILGTLFAVYRLWFAGEPEPPPPPPTGVTQPTNALSPFGEPSGGTPAPATGNGTAVHGGPRPGAGPGEPVHDLDSATRVVQELAATLLAAFPEAAQWASAPDAIRRAVAAADCIAQGGSPRQHLSFLEPRQPFQVAQTAQGTVIAPASYARYDRVAAVFCHGDAAKVAAAYKRLEPALDLAYRQLGYGQGRFRDVVGHAAAELLAVPVPAEPVYVVPSGRTYAFADSALQAQSDARKHLLRLGPANLRKVQARIRELLAAAGLEAVAP